MTTSLLYNEPQHITKCILSNGTICEYDACADRRDAYDPKLFRYIGSGKIYSIYGINFNLDGQSVIHFWVKP